MAEVLREGDHRELVLRAGVLGRTPPTTLGHDDLARDEQLTTPDTPLLATSEGRVEALHDDGAGGADALGIGDVGDLVGEEEASGFSATVGARGVAFPGGVGLELDGLGSSHVSRSFVIRAWPGW